MEFVKVHVKGTKLFYWTWRDLPFLPYAWLEQKDLESLPKPFLLTEIRPDCHVGFETKDKSEYTNVIRLPDSFDKIKMDKSLKKDLRRVEKKNSDLMVVLNEKDALDKSKKWFLSLWKESKRIFGRRLELWKQKCYTLSAYLNGELIAVHIAMQENDTAYYFGCWWDRRHKSMSVPTFLLKKDIERGISRRLKYYDLGIGDELYKKKWGVIKKPTKYYAILTGEIASYLGLKEFIEIASL